MKIAATERNPQPMTDYYPLIARAVEVLDRSTGEARRALYERARNALVAQLRSNQPALFEAQITKERLALEEAIRKVEAEATRKSHNESQAEQQAVSRAATSRAPTPEAVPQFRRAFEAPRRDRNNPPPTDMPRAGWTVPSARERLLSSRSSLKKRGVKDFGDVVGEVGAATAKATQTAVSPASGFEPEPAVRADVEILERRMTVTWSLRRNTDKALAASHTIEITFNLPADFPGGGIANVPGILMKQAEQARGTPLGTRRQGDQWILPHRAVRGGHRRAAQTATPQRAFLVRHPDRLRQRRPRHPGDGKRRTRGPRLRRDFSRKEIN